MARMSQDGEQGSERGARVRIPPPLWYAVAIVAGLLLPGLRMQMGAMRTGIGILAIFAGLGLGLSAVSWFRRTGQNPKPWTPSPELIIQGSYRFTRNPMYVGLTLGTVGIALLTGRGWMVLLGVGALAAVHFTAVVHEERYLTEKFGDAYRSYMARVRRYL